MSDSVDEIKRLVTRLRDYVESMGVGLLVNSVYRQSICAQLDRILTLLESE